MKNKHRNTVPPTTSSSRTTSQNSALGRRGFFKACLSSASVVAANPNILASSEGTPESYNRVLLVNEQGTPITSNEILTGKSYIFNYPYITTPCFLINLGSPATEPGELETAHSQPYSWPGGSGPTRAIVAFSAICAHKLSYPTPTASFINYRAEEITYMDHKSSPSKQKQLIYCCSERSVYDPATGAKVLGGPAPQPLTTITIEYDGNTDNYYATGTLGGEMYDSFFEKFGFRIALENGDKNIKQLAEHSTKVYPSENYTNYKVKC